MTAPDTYRTNLEIIQTHAREANRGAQPFATAAFLFTVLDDRHDAALDRAVTMLEGMYRVPFREAAPKYCLLGRPEDCLEQMQRFVDSGVRHFIIAPLSNPAETVETLANEILPSIRKLQ
jgi:alkanesulfonate monooxygenase SsuD/methylene tetrahydromethanopterin reductase-like flavin-dependent oxidoreductase (luciferase family)